MRYVVRSPDWYTAKGELVTPQMVLLAAAVVLREMAKSEDGGEPSRGQMRLASNISLEAGRSIEHSEVAPEEEAQA